MADNSSDYPQAPIATIDVPLWSERDQNDYMAERISLHQEAEFANIVGDRLPDCTDNERWAKDPKFAVKKGTNKRALRVFDSSDEAEAYIKTNNLDSKHHIEHRPGEYTRCASNWCRVAEFCDQWNEQE